MGPSLLFLKKAFPCPWQFAQKLLAFRLLSQTVLYFLPTPPSFQALFSSTLGTATFSTKLFGKLLARGPSVCTVPSLAILVPLADLLDLSEI